MSYPKPKSQLILSATYTPNAKNQHFKDPPHRSRDIEWLKTLSFYPNFHQKK